MKASGAVDEKVIAGSKLARRALAEALETAEATSDNVKRVLAQKAVFLTQCDKWFKIEQSFWMSSMGEPGTERMEQCILDCLPTKEKPMSMAQSDALFKSLSDCKLLQFRGTSMVSIFGSIHGFVTSMLQGRAPSLGVVTDNKFMLQVKDRMSLFCIATVAASSDETAEDLVGRAAAEHIFAAI